MGVKTLLRDEIQSELGELKKMEVGTDEYDKAINGITKLMDRAIEMDKLDIEERNKIDALEADIYYKKTQLEEEKKDRWFKNCIAVAGIIIPSVITIWGTKKSIEFEKEGTFTTIMGRGFIQKLLPKK